MAREAEIGARFLRIGDTVLTRGGNRAYVMMNRLERFAGDLIEADKELLDRAKDDRRFRAPAIGIAMMKILFGQEHAALAQDPDDVGVGVEDIFADEFRNPNLVCITAVIIDRRKDREAVF